MKESKAFLEKINLPTGDVFAMKPTDKRFPDGAQYRFEVPGIQNPKTMRALLEEMEKSDQAIHRITQTKGVYLLTDDELREMTELAAQYRVQLLLAIGPRATTDTSASIHTEKGTRMAFRLRGQEQLIRSLEEVKRGLKFGCKSFLLYDEGCLFVLNKMREMGEIPADTHFKISANCGYGNPASIKFMETAGANSVNPVWDLQLPMLGAIRQAIDIPMDVHIENPESTGGFIRHYEVPEMIKVAAPIYLKMGGPAEQNIRWDTVKTYAREHLRQIKLVQRMIDQYYPQALISKKGGIQ